MQHYEYKVISIREILVEKERILNEYGQQGWELICVDDRSTYYMKRIIE